MNHFQYAQVIKEFCEYCELDEPERIIHGGPLALGDVIFSLIYDEEANPELMFIYCDFGEIAEGTETEAYRALLEANMFLYNGAGSVFTVSSETGRVILAAHCRLDQMQPKALQETLRKMGEQAAAWRTDQFLNKP